MEKQYKVIGTFKGTRINSKVVANSKKQAKLRSAFENGIPGYDIADYMRTKKVRVK